MSDDEYARRLAEIEARANLAYGMILARRTGNGGRYWALGATVAAMASEPDRLRIAAWLNDQEDALTREYYRSNGVEI